jgi:hypothetical protein
LTGFLKAARNLSMLSASIYRRLLESNFSEGVLIYVLRTAYFIRFFTRSITLSRKL